MVKMCDLSEPQREILVKEISRVMRIRFDIDQDSINEFWDTVGIGIEVRSKA